MGHRLPPPHPGAVLLEDFLVQMGMSKHRLAKGIGVLSRLLAIGLLSFVPGCPKDDPCSQLVGIWAERHDDKWGIYMDGQLTNKVLIAACEGYALRPYRCEGNTISSTDGPGSCPSTFAFDNDRLTLMSGDGCDDPVGTVIVADLVRVNSDCQHPMTCGDPGTCRSDADVLEPHPEVIFIQDG
jgi:hypothetical protein